MTRLIVRGSTLSFRADPFDGEPAAAVSFDSDGAVLIEHGRIVQAGPPSNGSARNDSVDPRTISRVMSVVPAALMAPTHGRRGSKYATAVLRCN